MGTPRLGFVRQLNRSFLAHRRWKNDQVKRDQVIVITGGGSGIGAACALAFGRAKQAVAVLFHSDEEEARNTVREIEAAGGSGITVQVATTFQNTLPWQVRIGARVDF